MKLVELDDFFLVNEHIGHNETSIIKVIGVGGGGGNAVNHMFRKGIQGVEFMVCNTDLQALEESPVSMKIQLGKKLTEGLGAGNMPDVGEKAAIESLNEIQNVIEKNTKMVFITAGMGGGTGTGATPVIAKLMRELGVLTVGIVTIPFKFEGYNRINQAMNGIKELQEYVDALLIIDSEKLRTMYGNLVLSEAFAKADDILATAAKSLAEIITVAGNVNVDISHVDTILRNSGVAIMGSGIGKGENRVIDAVDNALNSPLLTNNEISGSSDVLLNIITGNDEISVKEVNMITNYLQDIVGTDLNIIWGSSNDNNLGNKINVTIIATGFEMTDNYEVVSKANNNRSSKKNELEFIIENESRVEKKIPAKKRKPSSRKKVVKDKRTFNNWVQRTLSFFDEDKDAEMN